MFSELPMTSQPPCGTSLEPSKAVAKASTFEGTSILRPLPLALSDVTGESRAPPWFLLLHVVLHLRSFFGPGKENNIAACGRHTVFLTSFYSHNPKKKGLYKLCLASFWLHISPFSSRRAGSLSRITCHCFSANASFCCSRLDATTLRNAVAYTNISKTIQTGRVLYYYIILSYASIILYMYI